MNINDDDKSQAERKRTCWTPMDLSAHCDGTYIPDMPTMLLAGDCYLLYPGKTHSFYGESESCKSFIAQHAVAEQLRAGNDVLYIDFEDTASGVVGRLRAMGVDTEDIRAHLNYMNPDMPPQATIDTLADFQELLGCQYTLAVIDGVTACQAMFDVNPDSNADVTKWMTTFTERIARETGAATVLIDHVTKSNDSRGRFAIGAQAKLSSLTGAAYVIDVKDGFGIGMKGKVVMKVAKDRPGAVRMCGGEFRSDRTQEIAVVFLESDAETKAVTVRLVGAKKWDGNDDSGVIRPVELMEKVSRVLEESKLPLSRTQIVDLVGVQAMKARAAITALEVDGYIKRTRESERAPYVLCNPSEPFRMPSS